MNDNGLFLSLGKALRGIFESFLPGGLLVDVAMFVVGIAGIIGLILGCALVLVYMERKVSGFMQMRLGPNRVGPYGLFQSFADVLKLISKEDIKPKGVDTWVWVLAPVLLFVPAVAAYAVIPFDKGAVFADVNIGVLYFLAISSLATLPFLMAGWSSNNKYSLIGGMRSVAQMVSYEIPLVFSLLGVVMLVGSMQMSEIVNAQANLWFVFLQPVAFVVYVIAATAEVNRTPFDIVESESEIVAGPFTEYSGMRWAFFFLAEYGNLFAVSAIASTIFLGGWNGPFLPGWLWFFLKTGFMIFVFMWFRWTFPRLRVDQLMHFGWKVLLPLALANIVVTGIGIYLYGLFS